MWHYLGISYLTVIIFWLWANLDIWRWNTIHWENNKQINWKWKYWSVAALLFSNSLPTKSCVLSRKRVDHLADLSQYSHYHSFLAEMQPDATHTHKHSHTVAQDRRYRARFSYKFPMGGNTRRHQLSGAPLLCFLVLSSCPSLLLYFHFFLLFSCSPRFCPQNNVFLVISSSLCFFNLFKHWHRSRNVSFMRGKLSLWVLRDYVCAAMRLDSSSQDCWAMKRVMTHTTSCICTPNTHMSINAHTDWGLPPDLTH